MRNIKEELIENNFGIYLYELRRKKEYTIEELAEKINMPKASIKNIRKWEYDLEFPDLDVMYKLSEIYDVPTEVLVQVRTKTLENGVKGIHKELIRLIGYFLGFSIYATIILSYVILFIALIWSVWYFVSELRGMEQYYLMKNQ